jgi:large subunit ribosomal protein L33
MAERIPISLACAECETRNYKTTRKAGGGGGNDKGQLSIKKYCPTCNKHTVHKETK